MTTKTRTVEKVNVAAAAAAFLFPPRRILVPLDLTEESLEGWKQARTIAGWFGAAVEAVYVQPWMPMAYLPMIGGAAAEPYFSPTAMKDSLALLHEKLGAGAVVNSFVGGIEDGIRGWARDGFDLIVMATHGRTGFGRALYGSIAEFVVRMSPIPVLVVRRKVSSARSVLAPVSLEPDSWGGLLAAGLVAESLGARLRVLHAVTGGLSGRASVHGLGRVMDHWIRRLPESVRKSCRPTAELVFGSPADQICIAGKRAGLVVVTARRKGLLSETVLGSTAERVLRHCPTPVLAIPSPPQKGAA